MMKMIELIILKKKWRLKMTNHEYFFLLEEEMKQLEGK